MAIGPPRCPHCGGTPFAAPDITPTLAAVIKSIPVRPDPCAYCGYADDAKIRAELAANRAEEELAIVRRQFQDMEVAALRVALVYEGLRVDANDGEFALWTETNLIEALHRLSDAVGYRSQR